MSKSLLRLAMLCAPLLLTACGEGWEVQRVSDYGTYEGGRTAGTGVAYVRAKMLPKKELVAEPVMEEITAVVVSEEEAKPIEEPAPVLEAENIFVESQQKGVAPKADEEAKSEEAMEAEEETAAVEAKGETASLEDVKKESEAAKSAIRNDVIKERMETPKRVLTPLPETEAVDGEDHSSMRYDTGDKMVAEDYIAQAPKNIIAPKVEVIKVSSYEMTGGDEVQMMKTAGIDRSDMGGVEIYENEVVQPQKHIIVPRKDMGAYLSVGEEELHEIYSQPF